MVTQEGKRVKMKGDRCGGNYSSAEVALDGEVMGEFRTPAEEYLPTMAALEAADPGCKPYFYLQDPEYIILKERFAQHILQGTPNITSRTSGLTSLPIPGQSGVPQGIASLEIGLEALKVAEYIQPLLADA